MSVSAAAAPPANQALDAVVERVKEGSKRFAQLKIAERIALLIKMRDGFAPLAEEAGRAAASAKGIDLSSPLLGEELIAGPMVTLRNMRLLLESLRQIEQYGVPRIDKRFLKTLADGRLAVKLYPHNTLDAQLLPKHEAWAHMQPGVTAENLEQHQAAFYRHPHQGRLCVVLGGGNQAAIPAMDTLQKMFVEGTAVILKVNPVNEYLGPILERAFKAAIDEGYLAVVYGAGEVGTTLVQHPLVDEVHITGSDKTHDLIVWGPPGPEREARKQRKDPLLKKEITSELGNISAVAVVPGPFTEAELEMQARNVAGMIAHNASFNCNAAKLLVVAKDWPLRKAFLAKVEAWLARTPPRKAYYPGSEARWKSYIADRPNVRLIGTPKEGEVPWAVLPDIDPATEKKVLHDEPWCAIFSEVALPAPTDPEGFLDAVVPFLNEGVWGTLCCTLIAAPAVIKTERFSRAVRELRFGAVVVNSWAGAVFGLSIPWGGHPGATLENVQSGRGWTHNVKMLEDVEKVVLEAPAKYFPILPWFPGHRTVDSLGRALIALELVPSWLRFPKVMISAVRA